MAVSNGQSANATTFNTAFFSRSADDNTTGKKDLQNTDPASGADVINVQREVNSLNAYTGRPSGTAHDADPIWVNNELGSSTDHLKSRLEAITQEFHATTGHSHNGTTGEGTKISATNLLNLNYLRADWQTFDLFAVSGTTTDVSTPLTGRTPNGSASSVGVITLPPNNKCYIMNTSTGTAIEDAQGQKVYGRITESSGVWTLSFFTNEAGVETAHSLASSDISVVFREVFNLETVPTIGADLGVISSLDATVDIMDASPTQRGLVNLGAQAFAGLKEFKDSLALTDTATPAQKVTLKSTSGVALTADRELVFDLNNANREIDLSGNLTVPSAATVSGTNTGDVTLAAIGATPNANGGSLSGQVLNLQPASVSFGGVVSTSAQAFAGDKTFQDFVEAQSELHGASETDNTTTGALQTLATPVKLIKRMTLGALTSVEGITASTKDQFFVLVNAKGDELVLKNLTGTAANQIITGTGDDLTMEDGASVWLLYDTVTAKWRVVGGSGGGAVVPVGYVISGPLSISASGTITTSIIDTFQSIKVQGNAAAVFAAALPFGSALGWIDGTMIRLVGKSLDNTVTIQHNDANYGCILNGDCTLGRYDTLDLQWEATDLRFIEISRSIK